MTGHTGSDGSSMTDRMSRHGQWLPTCSENIGYGDTDPFEIVMSLLVDDGVPSRGHRTNIMNGDSLVVGVACGPHQRYGTMCVQNFAGGFIDA